MPHQHREAFQESQVQNYVTSLSGGQCAECDSLREEEDSQTKGITILYLAQESLVKSD